ncbi:GIN domain-containing protein [Pedobacter sp. AW1-32]|uniref:GIN domain-containing protein n=1 Tax=Pedobacter sp. AW1-32 TaxID=3383026 RepID=UPI003FEF85FA
MKTSFKAIFATTLAAIVLSTSAFATENKSQCYTNISTVKNINKIQVCGNVKLIWVQDAKESIEINDSYYAKNALVQQQKDELRISSFDKKTLTVIAHVNNLTSIEASDDVVVETAGSFNLLNLKITLNDNAKANINSNTVALSSVLNAQSSLKLSGSTENYSAVLGSMSNVNMSAFNAADSTITAMPGTSLTTKNDDTKGEVILTIF